MTRPILHNTAIRSIRWHDLSAMTKLETARALGLSVPWLALSLTAAHFRLFGVALPLSAVFFMAALRQTHDGFHHKLGVGRARTHAFLLLFTLLMVVPIHAVKWIHLRHHADPLGDGDVEGMCADLPWWAAIAAGPWFTVRMVIHAYPRAVASTRRWIVLEMGLLVTLIGAAIAFDCSWLRYHIVVMAIGNGLTGFIAVWMTHHGCDRDGAFARTQRSPLINWLTLNNFFHMEHHLFPAVASCHLPELARRLDEVLRPERFVLGSPCLAEARRTGRAVLFPALSGGRMAAIWSGIL